MKSNSPDIARNSLEKSEINQYHDAVDALRRHIDSWIDGNISCSLQEEIDIYRTKEGEKESERDRRRDSENDRGKEIEGEKKREVMLE